MLVGPESSFTPPLRHLLTLGVPASRDLQEPVADFLSEGQESDESDDIWPLSEPRLKRNMAKPGPGFEQTPVNTTPDSGLSGTVPSSHRPAPWPSGRWLTSFGTSLVALLLPWEATSSGLPCPSVTCSWTTLGYPARQ